MLAAHALLQLLGGRRPATLPFSEFLQHAQEGRLKEVLMGHDRFEVRMKPLPAGHGNGTGATHYVTRVVPYMDRQKIIEMLDSKGVAFGTPMPSWGRRLLTLLLGLAPFLYLALVYRILNRTLYNPSDSVGKEHKAGGNGQKRRLVTFKDVAGIEQAKLELVEVVQFLRDRSRFVDIGARLPKGILLSGPPGALLVGYIYIYYIRRCAQSIGYAAPSRLSDSYPSIQRLHNTHRHRQDAASARRGERSRRALHLLLRF